MAISSATYGKPVSSPVTDGDSPFLTRDSMTGSILDRLGRILGNNGQEAPTQTSVNPDAVHLALNPDKMGFVNTVV